MSTHLYAVDKENRKLVDLGNVSEQTALYDYKHWCKFMDLLESFPDLGLEEKKLKDLDIKTFTKLVSCYYVIDCISGICCYLKGLIYCYNHELDLDKIGLIYNGSKEYESLKTRNKWEII